MKFNEPSYKNQEYTTGNKKVQMKNKSENMDYKYKNNAKKTTSINSTNFIIKNINGLGHSVYNKQNTYNPKGPTRKIDNKRGDKPKYKGVEYRVSNNTNGLFPYIINSKTKEQGVYIYK